MIIPRYEEFMKYERRGLSEEFDSEKFNRTQGAIGYLKKPSRKDGNHFTSELIRSVIPVMASAVMDARLPRRDPDMWDDMIQFSLLSLLRRLGGNKIFSPVATFFTLRQFFLWQLSTAYRQMGPKLLDMRHEEWRDLIGTVESQKDAENRIFLDELRVEIYNKVDAGIRFNGLQRDACLYMLQKLIEGADVHLKSTARLFDLKNPNFFKGYVLLLLRVELYHLRTKYKGIFLDTWAEQVYAA
jgi:hypothetical protein